MGLPTTSGTVVQTRFNILKVIEHAFRRAGRMPEKASAEELQIAQDLLFTQTAEWINAGFPLWTRQYILLGAQIGSPDVPCPPGTVDVFHTYWRILMPYRGAATLSTSQDGSVLFGGQPNADVTITGANPAVSVSFGSATEVDTIGVLLGGSSPVTAALQVNTSVDGVTWTAAQTLPSATFIPKTWAYFDLNPSVTAPYVQLVMPGSGPWILNQLNFGLANGTDIEIGPLNIDDYYNLPNKMFQADRADSGYLDRQISSTARDAPTVKIWPTLNPTGFYNGTVTVLARRYIQDPGALTNAMEVPPRWLEALLWRLACTLMYELPDQDQNQGQGNYFTLMAKQQRIQQIEQKATKAEALAWSEERTRAPIRFFPNISAYTA